jgi:hypothetical protein
LPPLYRTKIGIGMFLVTYFTGVYGSMTEDFIFRNCFIDELELLNKGIEVEIEGKKYFLQCRLILHVLDTKAIEKILKCSCATSYKSCIFCDNIITGLRPSDINKIITFGHRHFLPIDHFLRKFGQSTNCCDTNYFKSNMGTRLVFKEFDLVLYLANEKSKKWTLGSIVTLIEKEEQSGKDLYWIKDPNKDPLVKKIIHKFNFAHS